MMACAIRPRLPVSDQHVSEAAQATPLEGPESAAVRALPAQAAAQATALPERASAPALTVSVVVCVYTEERWPQIRLALTSLEEQTLRPTQVIVVADHNPPLAERIAALYPTIDVISNEYSRGLSGARNTGIEHSDGDVVAFLDDDARAEPRWLETVIASYADDSVLGVGGMVVPDWAPGERPRWLPPEFLWVVGCSYRGLPDGKADIRNPIGANMSFRRSAFKLAGLFCPSIGRTAQSARPLGCEETEFSIRLLEASGGGRIIHDPQAVVHHLVPRSRTTWRYFLTRCYAEGCSKAYVAQLSGAKAALSSERHYLLHALAPALRRDLEELFRSSRRDAVGRIAASVLGVSWTVAGYLRVQLASFLRHPRRAL
jgi:glucosyl-dolichyl phosphate glucuronosyltransferase